MPFKGLPQRRDSRLRKRRESYTLERVVAERKAFLSRKRLLCRARFRIVEEGKESHFTELLKESGFVSMKKKKIDTCC